MTTSRYERFVRYTAIIYVAFPVIYGTQIARTNDVQVFDVIAFGVGSVYLGYILRIITRREGQ